MSNKVDGSSFEISTWKKRQLITLEIGEPSVIVCLKKQVKVFPVYSFCSKVGGTVQCLTNSNLQLFYVITEHKVLHQLKISISVLRIFPWTKQPNFDYCSKLSVHACGPMIVNYFVFIQLDFFICPILRLFLNSNFVSFFLHFEQCAVGPPSRVTPTN